MIRRSENNAIAMGRDWMVNSGSVKLRNDTS